jgi:hypothetical protein
LRLVNFGVIGYSVGTVESFFRKRSDVEPIRRSLSTIKSSSHDSRRVGPPPSPNGDTGFRAGFKNEDHMATNGDALAREIVNLNASKRSITLFGHSMGGLIIRLAVLSGYRNSNNAAAHELIKRVIMFGTPNHGAVRASS